MKKQSLFPARSLLPLSLMVPLLMSTSSALAVDTNFDGSVVPGCTLTLKNYVCASVQTTALDGLTIAGGYTVDSHANVIANTAALAVDSRLNANITTATTFAMAANSYVHGNVHAGTTMAMAEGSHINGALTSGATLALAKDAYVLGDVFAETTISYAENAFNVGSLRSGTTMALAANAHVFGDINAGTTLSIAAGGFDIGDVTVGTTSILAAGAFVFGNLSTGTTVAMAAGSFVSDHLDALTVATLANNTCYGSISAGSITNANTGSSICGVDFKLPMRTANPFEASIVSDVPEPPTYIMLLTGLSLLGLMASGKNFRWKRTKTDSSAPLAR